MADGFEWDTDKDAENRRKHGITFEEAVAIWEGPVLTWHDDRFEYGETRETSIGMLGAAAVLTVSHTDRDGLRRIISARKATKSERRDYHAYLERTLG